MEFSTETVEVEEICEDGTLHRNTEAGSLEDGTVKYVINWPNATSDDSTEKVVTDGEEATIITYQFDMGEATECVELPTTQVKQTHSQRPQVAAKSNTPRKQINTSATINKNNRGTKRPIKTLDPDMPAFVCTEHEGNISLDCRYCRIAAGVKKKGIPKILQNNEITSSGGKVTVAIPKRDASCSNGSDSDTVQKGQSSSKCTQKFRAEWLNLPEFKDWLIECQLANEGQEKSSQAQCKYCGTLLVNNANNLVRHAISKKHMKNMELDKMETSQAKTSLKADSREGSEEIFGVYVASELKRIKNKKTYEEVKWQILQALQSAAEKEAENGETTP